MPVYHPQARFGPVRLWVASIALDRRGYRRLARALKAANWLIYKAVLPPEATVDPSLQLGHLGLGIVVHPNTTIGRGVHIWHQVTLASDAAVGSADRIIIEDDVEIGAGAKVVNRASGSLVLGRGARVGANAVVVDDVAPGVTVVGIPARPVGRP